MEEREPQKVTLVGYAMKIEREKGFVKRNALPTTPTNGVCFRRIDLDASLEPQLLEVDVVLHRMMDELQRVDWLDRVREAPEESCSKSGETSAKEENSGTSTAEYPRQGVDSVEKEASFNGRKDGDSGHRCFHLSAGHLKLERYCAAHPDLCVVDPFDRVQVLMDRFTMHDAIKDISLPGLEVTVRAPRAIQIMDRDPRQLERRMLELGLSFPCLMKPRVACGTPEAHAMALLLSADGLPQSPVSLPASVQEYVNHGGLQHKAYVLGSKLFHTPRVSMPDARELFEKHPGADVLTFDSLRSPLNAANSRRASSSGREESAVDERALEGIAAWLRGRLGLTLFGFDIVVQVETGDYVLVDVNYFPSFKDVPDDVAVPSFWKVLGKANNTPPGAWGSRE